MRPVSDLNRRSPARQAGALTAKLTGLMPIAFPLLVKDYIPLAVYPSSCIVIEYIDLNIFSLPLERSFGYTIFIAFVQNANQTFLYLVVAPTLGIEPSPARLELAVLP